MNLFSGKKQLDELFRESAAPEPELLDGEYAVDMLSGVPSLKIFGHKKIFRKEGNRIVGRNVIFQKINWGYFFLEKSEYGGAKTCLINYNAEKNGFLSKRIRDHIRYDAKNDIFIGRFNLKFFGRLFFLGYFSLNKIVRQ